MLRGLDPYGWVPKTLSEVARDLSLGGERCAHFDDFP